jgi:hypothetical protein
MTTGEFEEAYYQLDPEHQQMIAGMLREMVEKRESQERA